MVPRKLYIVSNTFYLFGVYKTKTSALTCKKNAMTDGETNVTIKYRNPQYKYIEIKD
jgi:hypothetical protein